MLTYSSQSAQPSEGLHLRLVGADEAQESLGVCHERAWFLTHLLLSITSLLGKLAGLYDFKLQHNS